MEERPKAALRHSRLKDIMTHADRDPHAPLAQSVQRQVRGIWHGYRIHESKREETVSEVGTVTGEWDLAGYRFNKSIREETDHL